MGLPSRTLRSVAALLLVIGAGVGCYRPFRPSTLMMQRAGSAREVYREADFTLEQLRQESISCLTPRLSFGHETYGRPLLEGLVESLRAEISEASVVHPSELASRINEEGLTPRYAAMLRAYDDTQILERDTLRALGEVIGVRFFGLPILVDYSESTSTRFSVFGVRLGKTASASLRVGLQIWDAETGRISWEGLSDLTLAQEVVREYPVRLDQTVRATWSNLVAEMPGASE